MSDPNDITVKYQRLAQEYAKLKAQNQVLKKAIVDAQDTTAKLKTDLQEKEQTIRRSQQEIDSSEFRSQQMVRRIELLQSELDQKGSKNKTMIERSPGVNSAFDEDLRQKIHQNELLHKQIHEYDTTKRQMEKRLNDEILLAKTAAKEANAELKSLKETHTEVIERLKQDKLELESKLKQVEKEAKELTSEMKVKIVELEKSNDAFQFTSNRMLNTIKDVVVFNDYDTTEYCRLKMLPHNKRHAVRAQELYKIANGMIGDFCKSLKDFHSFTQQRCQIYPVDSNYQPLSPGNLKLSEYLTEAESILDSVHVSFVNSFSKSISANLGVVKLEEFVGHLERYVAFLSKLLPYKLISLQEEYDLSLCAPTLQLKNADYLNNYKRFLPIMSKLLSYLSSVTTTNIQQNIDHPDNVRFAYQKVTSCMNELHLLFKDLSKAFNSKISLEYQLPTTSKAPELRTSNEFLLSSMLSFSSVTAKLCGFLQANIDFIVQAVSTNRNSTLTMTNLIDRSIEYLDNISSTSPPPSIPYHEALKKRDDLQYENREELVQQLQENSSKLQSLEQEKEHWLLETQLLQMKLEKQKHSEINDDSTTPNRVRHESLSLKPLETDMLGVVEMANHVGSGSTTTEDLIKQHLTSRLTDMSLKQQVCESKALHFESECRLLHKHLSVLRDKKQNLHDEVDKSSQRVAQLQDELSVTRRNYEEQLSLMSEHLTAMNDKLATQKDEIDNLKTKKPKKSKGLSLHSLKP